MTFRMPATRLDDASSRPSRVRYALLASLCAVAAIVYSQRQCMSVAESTLRGELGYSKEDMGWVLGIWLWTYALFQIPGGRLGDRWGSRTALPLYCVVWSLATLLTGYVTWLPLLLAIRLVFGAAHAGLFPCSAIIVRQWFPEERRGLATAWVGGFQQVGGAIGSVFVGWWLQMYLALWTPAWISSTKLTIPRVDWLPAEGTAARGVLHAVFDWRMVFVALAVPGLAWSFWFRRWFRDRPEDHAAVNDAERALLPATPVPAGAAEAPAGAGSDIAGPDEEMSVWRGMLVSSTMWLVCGQQFCRAAGYFFYQSWFPTYLQETRGISIEKSGFFTSLMFVAALGGSLCGGAVSDWVLARTGSRRLAKQGVALVGLLGAAALAAAAYATQSAGMAVAVLAGGSFCAAVAGPSAYSVTIDVAGRHTATVFGTMNMAGNIGAAVVPPLVPWLVNLPDRLSLPISGWNLVLFCFAGVYLAGAACWVFLNPHGTIGLQSRS